MYLAVPLVFIPPPLSSSAAIKAGYRHIDCARIYGNEREVGNGIARAIKEGIVTRDDLFITSKIWNNAHSTAAATANLAATLSELQISSIDLLLIHWHQSFEFVEGESFPKDAAGVIRDADPAVASVQICYTAMESFVDAGKVKSIGVSNFSIEQIKEVLTYARIKPVVNQIEVHPYWPQQEMFDYGKTVGLHIQAYSPLGNVMNAGEENITPLNEALIADIGKKYNKSPAQVILRWGIQHGGIVLPKSTTASRIAENFALFDFELTADDMAAIAKLSADKPKRFLNPQFGPKGAFVFPKA
jgi:diketogulonate reductase-like aldo/keto reductase